jgi:hypothetical protein
MNFIDALSATGYEAVATTNLDTKKSQYTITQNGNAVSLDNLKKLTLGDVLTGKYELSAVNCDIQSIANAVLSKMAELLGNGSQDIKGLNVDNESDEALSEAYSFTINQYSKGYATSKDSSKLYDLYTLAREQNNVITGKDNKSSFSITNMLKSYLTNFSILLDGFEAGLLFHFRKKWFNA